MYTRFYGLREKPFSLSPDPRFLFLSDAHREALAHLLYGIEQGEGFMAITGEVGTGKTMLCRTLLKRLDPGTEVAFLFNPQLSGRELLQAVLTELGLSTVGRSRAPDGLGDFALEVDLTHRELLEELNRFLLAKKREDRRVLVVVDEAQNLEAEALEQLRLLSNLETDTEKLIQIVLFGQPELDAVLEAPQLRQLRQRITVRWHLSPLSRSETERYVAHRLRVAAGSDRALFSTAALREVQRRSGGIPRLVNVICDRALLAGYAAEASTIGPRLVRSTDQELRAGAGTLPQQRSTRARWAIPVAVLLLLGGAGLGWLALDPLADDRVRARVSGFLDPGAPARRTVEPQRGGPLAIDTAPPLARDAGSATAASIPAAADALPDVSAVAGAATEAAEPPEDPPSLGIALARSSPAATTAAALDGLLSAWDKGSSPAQLLSLPQSLDLLRERGLQTLAFRQATPLSLRALDQPALLVLRALDGAPRSAVIWEIDAEGDALLLVGEDRIAVSFEELDDYWSGEAYVPWRDFERLPDVLRPGAGGAGVAWLQGSLADLGLLARPTSGQFDTATIAAVRALQQTSRLDVDGTVGPRTKIRLYQLSDRYRVPRLVSGGGAP